MKLRGVSNRTIRAVLTDLEHAELEAPTKRLLEFSRKMTRHAYDTTDQDVDALREVGWSDEQILEAVVEVGYFNMNNRIMDALGIRPGEESLRFWREELGMEAEIVGNGQER